ncbi:hypothetical protein ADUPG1_006446, partial [Aduncisulcus paluster]
DGGFIPLIYKTLRYGLEVHSTGADQDTSTFTLKKGEELKQLHQIGAFGGQSSLSICTRGSEIPPDFIFHPSDSKGSISEQSIPSYHTTLPPYGTGSVTQNPDPIPKFIFTPFHLSFSYLLFPPSFLDLVSLPHSLFTLPVEQSICEFYGCVSVFKCGCVCSDRVLVGGTGFVRSLIREGGGDVKIKITRKNRRNIVHQPCIEPTSESSGGIEQREATQEEKGTHRHKKIDSLLEDGVALSVDTNQSVDFDEEKDKESPPLMLDEGAHIALISKIKQINRRKILLISSHLRSLISEMKRGFRCLVRSIRKSRRIHGVSFPPYEGIYPGISMKSLQNTQYTREECSLPPSSHVQDHGVIFRPRHSISPSTGMWVTYPTDMQRMMGREKPNAHSPRSIDGATNSDIIVEQCSYCLSDKATILSTGSILEESSLISSCPSSRRASMSCSGKTVPVAPVASPSQTLEAKEFIRGSPPRSLPCSFPIYCSYPRLQNSIAKVTASIFTHRCHDINLWSVFVSLLCCRYCLNQTPLLDNPASNVYLPRRFDSSNVTAGKNASKQRNSIAKVTASIFTHRCHDINLWSVFVSLLCCRYCLNQTPLLDNPASNVYLPRRFDSSNVTAGKNASKQRVWELCGWTKGCCSSSPCSLSTSPNKTIGTGGINTFTSMNSVDISDPSRDDGKGQDSCVGSSGNDMSGLHSRSQSISRSGSSCDIIPEELQSDHHIESKKLSVQIHSSRPRIPLLLFAPTSLHALSAFMGCLPSLVVLSMKICVVLHDIDVTLLEELEHRHGEHPLCDSKAHEQDSSVQILSSEKKYKSFVRYLVSLVSFSRKYPSSLVLFCSPSAMMVSLLFSAADIFLHLPASASTSLSSLVNYPNILHTSKHLDGRLYSPLSPYVDFRVIPHFEDGPIHVQEHGQEHGQGTGLAGKYDGGIVLEKDDGTTPVSISSPALCSSSHLMNFSKPSPPTISHLKDGSLTKGIATIRDPFSSLLSSSALHSSPFSSDVLLCTAQRYGCMCVVKGGGTCSSCIVDRDVDPHSYTGFLLKCKDTRDSRTYRSSSSIKAMRDFGGMQSDPQQSGQLSYGSYCCCYDSAPIVSGSPHTHEMKCLACSIRGTLCKTLAAYGRQSEWEKACRRVTKKSGNVGGEIFAIKCLNVYQL